MQKFGLLLQKDVIKLFIKGLLEFTLILPYFRRDTGMGTIPTLTPTLSMLLPLLRTDLAILCYPLQSNDGARRTNSLVNTFKSTFFKNLHLLFH